MSEVRIATSSEDSIQIQFPQTISEEVNQMVSSFVNSFRQYTNDIPEIEEIVPTYCAVTVYFDSKECSEKLIVDVIKKVLETLELSKDESSEKKTVVSIPVCYEGEDFAPDLKYVAEHSGMTVEEVVKNHHSKDYLIYMLGFLPGFPYLGGMDERLETPRLETPRTKIPAGSIAIGGKQTGLYPCESPGGWQIIGRTPLKVFDADRVPSCLYEAGDRIRFVPISKAQFSELEKSEAEKQSKKTGAKLQQYVCTSGIKILEGGMLTSVQDYGRKGYQHSGIGQSGVMDCESFELLNKILGNEKNAACLEATVLGPTIKFVISCDFAITGGQCEPSLDGVKIQMNKKIHAKAGSILKCGFVTKGLRAYVGFEGGILVPEVLGSRSTNLKGKMGGFFGRKIQEGDEIAIGNFNFQDKTNQINSVLTDLPEFAEISLPENNEILLLECTKGSQFQDFSQETVSRFQKQIFTITTQSDRMGIRFAGESLNCGKTDIISDAIPFGSVQITSAGLPVVMAADRQTTGGYAKIAAVTRHSMCQLAQAVPGTKVKFKILGV